MALRSVRIGLGVGTLFASFLAVLPVSPANDGKKTYPRTVLIIRHAEKPTDESSVDLSAEGKKRADALPKLFEKSDGRPDPFPTPDFIFATKNSKRSLRPVETVTPLAEKLKLNIQADWADDDVAGVAREILETPKYAGKTVLICWHHGKIPELAGKLGATGYPPKFKDTVFDRVWQIGYDEQGKTTYRDRPQRLMPGDSEK